MYLSCRWHRTWLRRAGIRGTRGYLLNLNKSVVTLLKKDIIGTVRFLNPISSTSTNLFVCFKNIRNILKLLSLRLLICFLNQFFKFHILPFIISDMLQRKSKISESLFVQLDARLTQLWKCSKSPLYTISTFHYVSHNPKNPLFSISCSNVTGQSFLKKISHLHSRSLLQHFSACRTDLSSSCHYDISMGCRGGRGLRHGTAHWGLTRWWGCSSG